MKRTTVFGAALAAALSVGMTLQAQAGEVTVHGSTTVASNILLPHKSDIEKQSGQALRSSPCSRSRRPDLGFPGCCRWRRCQA